MLKLSKFMIDSNLNILLINNNQLGTSITFPSSVFSTEYFKASSISE